MRLKMEAFKVGDRVEFVKAHVMATPVGSTAVVTRVNKDEGYAQVSMEDAHGAYKAGELWCPLVVDLRLVKSTPDKALEWLKAAAQNWHFDPPSNDYGRGCLGVITTILKDVYGLRLSVVPAFVPIEAAG